MRGSRETEGHIAFLESPRGPRHSREPPVKVETYQGERDTSPAQDPLDGGLQTLGDEKMRDSAYL